MLYLFLTILVWTKNNRVGGFTGETSFVVLYSMIVRERTLFFSFLVTDCLFGLFTGFEEFLLLLINSINLCF